MSDTAVKQGTPRWVNDVVLFGNVGNVSATMECEHY